MRKRIAIFANGYSMEFLQSMLNGIEQSGFYNNYDYLVFLSHTSYDDPEEMNDGEFAIYRLPYIEDFDGVIVFTNCLNSCGSDVELVKRAVDCGTPVVSIGIRVEGAINVDIDNTTGIRELCEHLITMHNVRHAVIIGGKDDHPESIVRIDTCRTVFHEHGLDINDKDIFYGDWGNVKTTIITDSLAANPDGLPDAIICANDIMALACATELARLNIRVPEDVIVTGYDSIIRGQLFYPVLTTVSSDYSTIGQECIQLFNDAGDGYSISSEFKIPSKLVLGESCGCFESKLFDTRRKENARDTYSRYLDHLKLESSERTLTQLITDSTEYEGLNKRLIDFYSANRDIFGDDFFIVIHNKYLEDVMSDDNAVFEDGERGRLSSIVAISEGKVCDRLDTDRHRLIPLYDHDSGTNHIYYLMPLHNGRYNYGYCVISDKSKLMLGHMDLHSNLEKLMLAFKIQRSNIQLHIYNESLKRMSQIDAMTGLYNRLGYEKKAIPIYHECERLRRMLMVMFIDINHMKLINDSFGHISGDSAIRATASAIMANIKPDWIAVRFGGDEFLIIGGITDETEAEDCQSSIVSYISRINREENNPFTLSVSSGFILSDRTYKKPLTEYIKEADNLMYVTKRKLHSENGHAF